jgi:hypothetical protein
MQKANMTAHPVGVSQRSGCGSLAFLAPPHALLLCADPAMVTGRSVRPGPVCEPDATPREQCGRLPLASPGRHPANRGSPLRPLRAENKGISSPSADQPARGVAHLTTQDRPAALVVLLRLPCQIPTFPVATCRHFDVPPPIGATPVK